MREKMKKMNLSPVPSLFTFTFTFTFILNLSPVPSPKRRGEREWVGTPQIVFPLSFLGEGDRG